MIKVENDMLVLDNTFTKEDVQAIDEFVKINVDRERKRILLMLQERGLKLEKEVSDDDGWSHGRYEEIIDVVRLIQNSGE